MVEQIILLIVPSAIAHLHLKATELQKPLPLDKLKYLALSEPFPESTRTYLQKQAGIAEDQPFMFSMYGSTDTGEIGTESLATVALRKLLVQNKTLAQQLGIDLPIPLFFYFITLNTFLETVGSSFCVTKWQGIPLVRYFIHDKVAFYSWRNLKQAILNSKNFEPEDEKFLKIIKSASNWLLNLVSVTGRSDSCLILGGTNLTEYILEEAVKAEQLQKILTGIYHVRLVSEEERQFLELDLEVRQDIEDNEEVRDKVYYSLIQSIGQLEPLFLSDWQNIYRHWDNCPNQRILRLNFQPYPNLSKIRETFIKQRAIY